MFQLRIIPNENIIEHSFRLLKVYIKTEVKFPYIISRSPRLDGWVLRFGSSWCLLVEWSWWHNIAQWSRSPYFLLFSERYSQKKAQIYKKMIYNYKCHCMSLQHVSMVIHQPTYFWLMHGDQIRVQCFQSSTRQLQLSWFHHHKAVFDMGFKPILVASCRLSALPMNFTHEFASRWKQAVFSLEALRSLQHPQRHRGNRLGVDFGSRDLDFY